MLFGGLFLYLAYYGCDQSQVQRILSTRDIDNTNRALLLNGVLRFPLVLLYCLVGVGIASHAVHNPDFLPSLPLNGDTPEYNLAVPMYMLDALPPGLVGLAMVALFAAAMSSLDSVINSLSATTMEDFVRRLHRGAWTPRRELLLSRWITALWGTATLVMAFYVGDIAPTVLEAINKIGSLANGPILAVFALGFFTSRTGGGAAISGLLLGIGLNALCWAYLPDLSWLWWNPLGFAAAFATGLVVAAVAPAPLTAPDSETRESSVRGFLAREASIDWYRRSRWLLLWFGAMLALLWILSSGTAAGG
jgi:SSS family solute:Na+ symporter